MHPTKMDERMNKRKRRKINEMITTTVEKNGHCIMIGANTAIYVIYMSDLFLVNMFLKVTRILHNMHICMSHRIYVYIKVYMCAFACVFYVQESAMVGHMPIQHCANVFFCLFSFIVYFFF